MNDYIEMPADDLDTAASATSAAPSTPANETPDQAYVRRVKDAQARVKAFELSPMQRRLLTAACENVANSKGTGLNDEARNEALNRAALFKACNNELKNVLIRITDSVPHAQCASLVYSVCFAVQKSANFVGNLWYRRALDPNDGEGTPVHDYRDQREAPYGLGAEAPDSESSYESIEEALEIVHIYLQLLTETCGWDPDSPMPYLFLAEKDGRFTPIHDVGHVFDIMEVRAQTARVKRQSVRAAGLAACLEGARDALLNA